MLNAERLMPNAQWLLGPAFSILSAFSLQRSPCVKLNAERLMPNAQWLLGPAFSLLPAFSLKRSAFSVLPA